MIFGKGECRRTGRTSNENLTKSAKIAAFWQGSFYSWLAYECRRNRRRGFFGQYGPGKNTDEDAHEKLRQLRQYKQTRRAEREVTVAGYKRQYVARKDARRRLQNSDDHTYRGITENKIGRF